VSSPPLELEILRYRPDVEEEGTWERYSVPCHPDDSLLDALHHIKDEIDPSLSYRWSCRMGVCGSCAVTVDGVPQLACSTRVGGLKAPVRVTPLANFPVLRDLVVGLDDFLERLRVVKPWLIPGVQSAAADEPRQTPAQLAEFAGFAACIHCGVCDAACPALDRRPQFLGPAAIAFAWRYSRDSRDAGEGERHLPLVGERGVWSCTQSGACSVVCPQAVDPAQAVQRSQLGSALRWLGLRRSRP
jgi:fumarate reductase iron-sulfur subunit